MRWLMVLMAGCVVEPEEAPIIEAQEACEVASTYLVVDYNSAAGGGMIPDCAKMRERATKDVWLRVPSAEACTDLLVGTEAGAAEIDVVMQYTYTAVNDPERVEVETCEMRCTFSLWDAGWRLDDCFAPWD